MGRGGDGSFGGWDIKELRHQGIGSDFFLQLLKSPERRAGLEGEVVR